MYYDRSFAKSDLSVMVICDRAKVVMLCRSLQTPISMVWCKSRVCITNKHYREVTLVNHYTLLLEPCIMSSYFKSTISDCSNASILYTLCKNNHSFGSVMEFLFSFQYQCQAAVFIPSIIFCFSMNICLRELRWASRSSSFMSLAVGSARAAVTLSAVAEKNCIVTHH